ncbi:MAG: SDR family oxidoreductase [Saprospiraceae bacterium]|nr:SDR family oxidoreductase [Saprospiraceae bacterium]
MINREIILVTGANSGIGKSTAIGLAQLGKTIIMVCRSQERGEIARKEIIFKSKNENIFLELCDLSSHSSILECTKRIRKKFGYLDVLINNAGAIFGQHELTEDGLEKTFGLNHMGYFLFTHYSLDLLKAGTTKRIINVASLAHKFVFNIPWSDLQLTSLKYKQLKSYSLSKLYNIYFTTILAQKLKADNITVNCLHPGIIYSGFGASGTNFFSALVKIGGPFLSSPTKGARTSIYLATSTDVNEESGCYFVRQKKAKTTIIARNMDNAKRLWDMTIELAGISEYGVVE